jgi:hypothetical protein
MMTLRLRHIFIFAFAILLTACQFEDNQECPDEINVGTSYINLTIAVSNGKATGTRAGEMPASGEDGNGREAGFERENAVTGITLILYQGTGINGDGSQKLDFVRYFSVTRDGGAAGHGTPYAAGSGHSAHSSQIEAKYTTGPQLIGKAGISKIDFTKAYHALVVANYDLTGSLVEGSSTLANVRDVILSTTYSGGLSIPASSAANFVMSSEEDVTLNFADAAIKSTDTSGEDTYDFSKSSNYDIVIERMAARIDFWAKGGTYDTSYPTAGYVYRPWKTIDTESPSSADRFVITRITPFNLNNGTEYLLKRTNDVDKYLASETGNNYVIDPTTSTKIGTATPSTFVNALSGIAALANLSTNAYSHSVADMHAQIGTGKTGGFSYSDGGTTAEDIIICYPMENTLPDASPLYYYATGIAIEGDYYVGNNKIDATKREHRVYFGYIRHQGESAASYDALLPSDLSSSVKTSSDKPMNFGIVRNNIYRISIDKVLEKTEEAPKLKIKIEEEKWRHVEHPSIYI